MLFAAFVLTVSVASTVVNAECSVTSSRIPAATPVPDIVAGVLTANWILCYDTYVARYDRERPHPPATIAGTSSSSSDLANIYGATGEDEFGGLWTVISDAVVFVPLPRGSPIVRAVEGIDGASTRVATTASWVYVSRGGCVERYSRSGSSTGQLSFSAYVAGNCSATQRDLWQNPSETVATSTDLFAADGDTIVQLDLAAFADRGVVRTPSNITALKHTSSYGLIGASGCTVFRVATNSSGSITTVVPLQAAGLSAACGTDRIVAIAEQSDATVSALTAGGTNVIITGECFSAASVAPETTSTPTSPSTAGPTTDTTAPSNAAPTTDTTAPSTMAPTTLTPGANGEAAPASEEPAAKKKRGISTAATAGLIAGMCALVIVIAVAAACYRVRAKQRRSRENHGQRRGDDDDYRQGDVDFTELAAVPGEARRSSSPPPAIVLSGSPQADPAVNAAKTCNGDGGEVSAQSTPVAPTSAFSTQGSAAAPTDGHPRKLSVDYLSRSRMSSNAASNANSDAARATRNARIRRWIERDEYQKGRLLGRGACGSVFAVLLRDGSTIALKEINLTGSSDEAADDMRGEAERELRLISNVEHENLVKYYAAKYDASQMQVRLFMENVTGGSLGTLVRTMNEPLTDRTAAAFVAQIVDGLSHLHANNIVHRDLKCDNILRDAHTGVVKIADFGTARIVDHPERATTRAARTMIGTPYFMAPEVLSAGMLGSSDSSDASSDPGGYGRKADIWSLGITVAELLNQGNVPWPAFPSPGHAFLHISNPNTLPELPEGLSEGARGFILRCCQRDPKLRPSAEELADDIWLQPVASFEADESPHHYDGESA